MSKIKILVHNATGSERRPAELCLNSGIISYDNSNEISHIAGKTVYKVVEEVAPTAAPVTKDPEPVKENKPAISVPQSAKKKPKKP